MNPPAGHQIPARVLACFEGQDDVLVIPMTCTQDRYEHAVTDTEVARARPGGRGIYRAMCDHDVLPGSLASPPGRPCPACLAVLASLPPQVGLAHADRGWPRLFAAARRVLGRATTPDQPTASHDRHNSPSRRR